MTQPTANWQSWGSSTMGTRSVRKACVWALYTTRAEGLQKGMLALGNSYSAHYTHAPFPRLPEPASMSSKFFLTSLLLLASGCAAEPVPLALRPVVGQEDVYSYSYRQQILQEAEKQTTRVDQTLKLGWSEVVQSTSPSTVDLTFESVGFKLLMSVDDVPRYTEAFDSNDPESQPSLSVRGYAGLVGRGFGMRVDSKGESIELSGCEDLSNAVVGEMYDAEKPNEVVAGESFARQITTEAWTDLLRPFKAIYPDGPVGIGDSWSRKIDITAGFPYSQDSRFTLVERTDGKCRVVVEATITPQEGSPISDFGGSRARTELEGEQHGEFTLDEASGKILYGKLESQLEGQMSILGAVEGMFSVVPMKFTGTLEIRLEQ